MTGKMPQEWIEAGKKAAEAKLGFSVDYDGVEAALAAVLPLIVKSMMEPSFAAVDAAYNAVAMNDCWSIEDDVDFKAALRAMLRAWARERSVDMGET